MKMLIIYGCFLIVCIIVIVILLLKAPIGWEDKNGFHKK